MDDTSTAPSAGTWLTIEQVCAATGWHPHHVQRVAGQGKITVERSGAVRANGKPIPKYALTSLPADAQVKYLQGRREREITVRPDAILEKRAETLPLFAAAPEVTREERLELDASDRKKADRRLDIIAPLIDFRRRTNGSRPMIEAGGRKVANLNDLAEWLSAQHGVSASSIWRWFVAWQNGGYAALAGKVRKDRGKSRVFESSPAAAAFIQQKYCNEGLNAFHAHEALCREWKKVAGALALPSYATVRRYLAGLPAGIKTLTREGAEAYHAKCSPFILRKAPPAMEWWISDHRMHDVFVRNRYFSHLNRDQAYRPWLTAVYDWGSRKIVGFIWAPTPSSATIAAALRAAARPFGFPAHFYWDNGKDFRKVKRDLAAIEPTPAIGDALRLNGAEVTSALPKHPRSKPIEAYFVRWSLRFDRIWGAAYAGNKPENCRPECREAQKKHQEFLAGKRQQSPLPSDAEFFEAGLQWVEEYNSTRLDCLDGRTPNEVFDEQYPVERRRPASQIDLHRLLSARCERTILAGGCVEIDKLRYEPAELSLGALHVRIGEKLTILRDPYNLGEAAAIDERGFFVGDLQLQQFVGQDPGNPLTHEQIKSALRRERALKRAYSQYRESLAMIAGSCGWQTEREALIARARRTGTDNRELVEQAVPGARLISERSIAQKVSSPFVDDAVRDFLAEESKA